MSDKSDVLDFSKGNSPALSLANLGSKERGKDNDPLAEDACAAFGYLRGLHERAVSLQLRFRDGNSDFFPYNWLGPCRFNPSVGLLLKFTGDIVTLVLIRGSNLDALVNQSINLTDRGIQRHRILWIREMDEKELRTSESSAPTIDRIEVVEFAGHDDAQEWLMASAPAFAREPVPQT